MSHGRKDENRHSERKRGKTRNTEKKNWKGKPGASRVWLLLRMNNNKKTKKFLFVLKRNTGCATDTSGQAAPPGTLSSLSSLFQGTQ